MFKDSVAQLLATLNHTLGGQHVGMWKGFIFVWLNCYSTTDLADDFLARETSHVDKSIIKGCKNVADTKYILSFSYLRSEADDLVFLLFLLFVRCHYCVFSLGYAMRKLTVFYVQVCKYVIQFSCSFMSDSLWPHGLQHIRPPCPLPTPRACSNSCPSSQWSHPTISSSVIPFSSCLQFFPASGAFPMSWLFALGGQSIGTWALASVLPINIQGWF